MVYYLKKNNLLIKKYLSLKYIKILHKQFQENRHLYVLSIFMYIPIKMMNKIKKEYFMNIYSMMKMVNYHKLLSVLCYPPIEYLLFPKIIQIFKKYMNHFNKKPKIYDNLISPFFNRINEFDFLNKKDLIILCFNKGIKMLANYT